MCMSKYPTQSTCIRTLKLLFTDPAIDTFTVEQICRAVGRDLSNPEKNQRWLANFLVPLKHYGLLRAVYSDGHPRRVSGVQLTPEGKSTVGETAPPNTSKVVSLEALARTIRVFERQNPGFVVDFRVTIRE